MIQLLIHYINNIIIKDLLKYLINYHIYLIKLINLNLNIIKLIIF